MPLAVLPQRQCSARTVRFIFRVGQLRVVTRAVCAASSAVAQRAVPGAAYYGRAKPHASSPPLREAGGMQLPVCNSYRQIPTEGREFPEASRSERCTPIRMLIARLRASTSAPPCVRSSQYVHMRTCLHMRTRGWARGPSDEEGGGRMTSA